MPHAFKAHPKHPAVEYLVRLHADIGGQIKANKAEALRLAEAMRHVEAVIKLFDPSYSVRAISARRRQRTNPWFRRGTLFRQALEALRAAGEPLTVAEITASVLAANNIDNASDDQRHGIEAAIRASLETNTGKTVQRVGDGVPRRWKLASQSK